MPATKYVLQAARTRSRAPERAQKLHVLRALLRECSYLPDPNARVFIKKQILSRYKAYQPTKVLSVQPGARAPEGPTFTRPLETAQNEERLDKLAARARKALRYLTRANEGELVPLKNLLYWTYGRKGPRKIELLRPWMLSNGVRDTPDDIVGQLLQRHGFNLHQDMLEQLPRLHPAIDTLLRSQNRLKSNEFPFNQSWLRPQIGGLTIWERRLPVKRVKNIIKEWYAEALGRILAPLPELEWRNLLALVHGSAGVQLPPVRRPMGTTSAEEDVKFAGVSLALVQALEIEKLARKRRPGNPHKITPRFIYRLHCAVFEHCPLVTWNPDTKEWTVQWGRVERSQASTGARAACT